MGQRNSLEEVFVVLQRYTCTLHMYSTCYMYMHKYIVSNVNVLYVHVHVACYTMYNVGCM